MDGLKGKCFVDIGTHTAFAFWYGDRVEEFIVDEFTIKSKDREGFLSESHDRFSSMMYHFTKSKVLSLKKIIFEVPELWDGSLKSHTSAIRGDLFKLSMQVGIYVAKIKDYSIPFKLMTAKEWKGQLTKEATTFLVQKFIGRTFNSEHINDAVAMGLSLNMQWSKRKRREKKNEY